MKPSLKIKAFSLDTEAIEQGQMIDMLDKTIMLNHGQMLSKAKNLKTLCKHLLSTSIFSNIFCSSEFSNCMFLLIILSILQMVVYAVTHEQSSNNNLFNRITVHHWT